MATAENQTYLRHDVMLLVDTMAEHYKEGRMDAYDTMRTDMAEWVDAMQRLMDSANNIVPVLNNVVEQLYGGNV